MASRTVVIKTDDIDKSEGAETIGFGLDGVSYEIDLGDDNADALREALTPYIKHARKVSGGRARRGRSRAASATPDRDLTVAVRAWARETGRTVSDRGRLPGWLIKEYEAAH